MDVSAYTSRTVTSLTRTKQFQATLDDVDREALQRRVAELRPGHQCSISLPDRAQDIPEGLMGGFNLHATLRFDDEVEWLVRLPGYARGRGSREVATRIRHCEVLTHEVLSCVGVPVAKVFDWGIGTLSSQNGKCQIHQVGSV